VWFDELCAVAPAAKRPIARLATRKCRRHTWDPGLENGNPPIRSGTVNRKEHANAESLRKWTTSDGGAGLGWSIAISRESEIVLQLAIFWENARPGRQPKADGIRLEDEWLPKYRQHRGVSHERAVFTAYREGHETAKTRDLAPVSRAVMLSSFTASPAVVRVTGGALLQIVRPWR
jgi:hypothetical protein